MTKIPAFVLRQDPDGQVHWIRVGWIQAECGVFAKRAWPITTPERVRADGVEICQDCEREMSHLGMKGH